MQLHLPGSQLYCGRPCAAGLNWPQLAALRPRQTAGEQHTAPIQDNRNSRAQPTS